MEELALEVVASQFDVLEAREGGDGRGHGAAEEVDSQREEEEAVEILEP